MLEFTNQCGTWHLTETEAANLARVTPRTIRRLKNGEASWHLVEFLKIHAERRVIPENWKIWTTEKGFYTFNEYQVTPAQLMHYGMQLDAYRAVSEAHSRLRIENRKLTAKLNHTTNQEQAA